MAKVNPLYKKTIEQIRIDSENYADNEMQAIYSQQNDKLDAVHTMIGLIYIKYAVDGLLNLSGKDKANMMNSIDTKLTTITKDLGDAEVKKVSSILGDTYKDTYYKNAFVMQNFGISTKFNILKKEFIDANINAVYKESTFSDRIWKAKSSMMDKLRQSLIDANDGKTTIDKVGKSIKDIFGTTAWESRRLVRNETARNATSAQLEIGKNSGCKQVMWSATLDSKTAEYDASLDSQTWGIDEDHPIPVDDTHPNCRCVLINVPYEGWQPTQRKDNETKDLIDNTDYATWAQKNGINDNTDNTAD